MSKKGSIPKAGPQTQSFRPAADCDRYPSDPASGCSSPELGASGEPRYSAKPPVVHYENTEPDLGVRKEPLSAFQNIDPMDIDFDTKMAYQSLSDFQNGRCEQVNKGTGCKQSFALIRILFCISLFFSLFAFLLALGGLGLASYNFLDSDLETAEPVAPQESHTEMLVLEVMELRAQLNQSLATIDTLNAIVEELGQNLTRIKEENLETIADMSSYINNISDIVQELLANPPTPATTENTTVSTPSPPAAKSKQLALYENCTRLTLASCSVPMGLFTDPPSFAACDTRFVPWEVEDYYTLDLYCAVTSSNGEENPIITTLEVDEIDNSVKCSCYVTVLSSDDFSRRVVDCGIFATRCPTTYDFNLN